MERRRIDHKSSNIEAEKGRQEDKMMKKAEWKRTSARRMLSFMLTWIMVITSVMPYAAFADTTSGSGTDSVQAVSETGTDGASGQGTGVQAVSETGTDSKTGTGAASNASTINPYLTEETRDINLVNRDSSAQLTFWNKNMEGSTADLWVQHMEKPMDQVSAYALYGSTDGAKNMQFEQIRMTDTGAKDAAGGEIYTAKIPKSWEYISFSYYEKETVSLDAEGYPIAAAENGDHRSMVIGVSDEEKWSVLVPFSAKEAADAGISADEPAWTKEETAKEGKQAFYMSASVWEDAVGKTMRKPLVERIDAEEVTETPKALEEITETPAAEETAETPKEEVKKGPRKAPATEETPLFNPNEVDMIASRFVVPRSITTTLTVTAPSALKKKTVTDADGNTYTYTSVKITDTTEDPCFTFVRDLSSGRQMMGQHVGTADVNVTYQVTFSTSDKTKTITQTNTETCQFVVPELDPKSLKLRMYDEEPNSSQDWPLKLTLPEGVEAEEINWVCNNTTYGKITPIETTKSGATATLTVSKHATSPKNPSTIKVYANVKFKDDKKIYKISPTTYVLYWTEQKDYTLSPSSVTILLDMSTSKTTPHQVSVAMGSVARQTPIYDKGTYYYLSTSKPVSGGITVENPDVASV